MSFRRNWFIYLALSIYMAATLLIFIFGVNQFKERLLYPYLSQVILIVGFLVFFVLINMFFYIITRPKLVKLFMPRKKLAAWSEAIFVILILVAGVAVRLYYIHSYPLEMESDYKFYYDVAKMIRQGTLLTESNNEFICLFPNTFGYSYVLSLVLRVFGTAKEIGLYFNVGISILTSFFCYRIGKRLIGRLCGISALLLSCFWPSQIIFSNTNGSEATFTCMLFGAVLLTVYVMKKYDGLTSKTVRPILLHFLIGILLSLAASIRPMALIFLIALVLCLLSVNKKLKFRNINELSLGAIFLSKGWFRAVVVIAGYMMCTLFVNAGISNAIQKEAAGSGALGYSLLVGVNIKSDGGYSPEIMDILSNSYEETLSAQKAHQVCMDKAIASIKADPIGTLELFAKKYYLIWSNDDYATTTNIATMNNQGLLTPEREKSFYHIEGWNNVYYLFVVLLSAIGVGFLFKKDDISLIFPVFFVGAAVLHILVEVQNRYHYYLLQNFAILAAVGLGFLFQVYLQRTRERWLVTTPPLEDGKQDTIQENQGDNSISQINVLQAIKDGHIIITATPTYQGGTKTTILDQEPEINTNVDDNEINSSVDDNEINSSDDDNEINSSVDDNEINSSVNDNEINSSVDANEMNTSVDDNEANPVVQIETIHSPTQTQITLGEKKQSTTQRKRTPQSQSSKVPIKRKKRKASKLSNKRVPIQKKHHKQSVEKPTKRKEHANAFFFFHKN